MSDRIRSTGTWPWSTVVVLMLAYTLSFIDRQVLGLLVQPIKSEFGVTDTQVGLLQGFAFALFYTVLSLPMGRIVDRHNRRNLIAAGVFLWSLMTVAGGAALTYAWLFVARMGVGVGEATLSPAAFSIISDDFRRGPVATAMSVYSMGVFIGAGLAFIVGGAVVQAVATLPPIDVPGLGAVGDWRLAFLVAGAPGILLTFVILRLREPERTDLLRTRDGEIARLGVRDVVGEVARRWRPVAGITLGMACHAICMYGVFAWAPTWFIRRFGWTPGETGMTIGLVVILAGCTGMAIGGWLADRWKARGAEDGPLRVAVLAASIAAVCGVVALTADRPTVGVAMLVPTILALAMPVGSVFASMQLIFSNQVRGQASALFLCVISLIGISLGPLLPAWLSERFFGGGAAIGTALAITVGVAAVGMAIAFRATWGTYRHFRAEHARVH
jgi:MFS family permease